MLRRLVAGTRRLMTEEQYVMILVTEDDIFMINKSYFGNKTPIRTCFESQEKRIKRLIEQTFLLSGTVLCVPVTSKGLSFKTTVLVCQIPPDLELHPDGPLPKHLIPIVSIDVESPRRAQLIRQACEDAKQGLQKAA